MHSPQDRYPDLNKRLFLLAERVVCLRNFLSKQCDVFPLSTLLY